jgi:hypothetical protein
MKKFSKALLLATSIIWIVAETTFLFISLKLAADEEEKL